MSNIGEMQKLYIMYPKEHSKRLFFVNSTLSEFYLLLFFLLFSTGVSAQQVDYNIRPILFRGVVVDAFTQNPIEGVQYFSDRQASTDSRGMFSFYAHIHDTVVFKYTGYKDVNFILSDTLHGSEYTVGIFMNPDTLFISEVVILPHIGNLKSEIFSNPSTPDFETINAQNNLRISAYQGIVGINKLGDPSTNYEVLRQKQRTDAYEKGGIPSDRMVGLSPFTIIPVLYMLIKGMPEKPEPPTPNLSPKELKELQEIHNSMTKRK
jgi:hypothetical protein